MVEVPTLQIPIAQILVPLVGLSVIGWTLIGLLRRADATLRLATALVGTLWMMAGIVAVDALAAHLDWWHYLGDGPRLGRSPIQILVPWAVAWGALPLAVADVPRPAALVAVAGLIDVVAVPRLGSIVELGPAWWLGEALLLGLVAWPGAALVHLMRTRRRLAVRTAALAGLFSTLTVGLVPMISTELTGVRPRWPGGPEAAIWAQMIGLAALPGLAAVIELYRAGGTPYPWDPPRTVTWSGPYAYVANPMQLSMTVILALTGAALRHWPTLLAAATGAAFAAGLAAWHEKAQLDRRWGDRWRHYATDHRSWLPTWRPVRDPAGDAVLELDLGCPTCRSIGRWIDRRRPTGLTIADAADSTEVRWRATYRDGVGTRSGVAAVGAAIGHLHLGWAVVGWFLGLPLVSALAQLISDAIIAAPHPVGGGRVADRSGRPDGPSRPERPTRTGADRGGDRCRRP